MKVSNRGFTVIQTAITLPLLLLLVVCTVDICIYFVGQGLLDSAASQTAAEVSVDPGLDNPTKASRDAAIGALRSSVTKFGQDTLIRPTTSNSILKFYVPAAGEVPPNPNLAPFAETNNSSSYVHFNFPFDYNNVQPQANINPGFIRNSFIDQPIEVLVHGEARTLFLGHFIGNGGSIPITGRAIAYRQSREPPKAAPVNPCGTSSNPSSGPCACSGIMAKSSLTGLCMCPGDYIDVSGTCMCPGNSKDPDTTDSNYVCLPPSCKGGTVLNSSTMLCEAPLCPGTNMTYDKSGNCICNTGACNFGNKYQDLNTCQCIDCPTGSFRSSVSNVCHSCAEADEFDKLTCKSGEFKNPDTCACETCKTKSKTGNSFFFRVDSKTNSCVCDNKSKKDADKHRGAYQWFDFGTCSIQDCGDARIANSSGTSCECPGTSTGVSDCSSKGPDWIFQKNNGWGICRCYDCSNGGKTSRTSKSTRTACECPPLTTPCISGEFYSSTSCQCEPNSKCGAAGNDNRTIDKDGKCICSNSSDKATCTANQRWNGVECACQDCTGDTVPTSNGKNCQDCTTLGKVANSSNTDCECDPKISCQTNERVDPSTCQCTACPPGKKPDLLGTSCVCAGDTSCAGFDPVTCQCAACPSGTVFTAVGYDHCCAKSGYVSATPVNICEQVHQNLGYNKSSSKKICKTVPGGYAQYNRYVCSNCDSSTQACGNLSWKCLKGKEPCVINPRE